MIQFLIPLLQGLLAVFAISGVGRLALWPVSGRDLGWYWQLAFIMLGGQAVTGIIVEAALLGGIGSVQNLRLLAWILISVAVAGHLLAPAIRTGGTIGQSFRENKFWTAILFTAWFTNLVVALAPSTKIDELYYQMLMPKRIVEDGRLRFYRLPLQSAIVPHMHYQIALSVAHAIGAPDAGEHTDKIDVHAYHVGRKTDSVPNEVRQVSRTFRHIPVSLEETCQAVLADRLHLLVYLDIGLSRGPALYCCGYAP